jgi:hypothetical protein
MRRIKQGRKLNRYKINYLILIVNFTLILLMFIDLYK